MMKQALSAVVYGSSTTALHSVSLWFAPGGVKSKPINCAFPVDVSGRIFRGIIAFNMRLQKRGVGRIKREGQEGKM